MRKKIILLLIFIVSFLGFGLNVKADLSRSEYEKTCWSGANIDHSLTYNITKFVVDSNDNLSINGWAFIHNCDNYGGSVPLPSEGVWWSSRKISDRSRLVVKIVFVNESNNSKYEKAVNFDGSVSDWSQFLKYGNSSDGWYYKNIGFNFNVNLNDVANSIGNGTISMKINASLPDYNPNWVITEDLAVYDNRKNLNQSEKIIDIADENKFEILNPSDRVRVTGNRVVHTSISGQGTWYWALTSKKSGLSYKAKNWYYDGDGMLWYELYYGNSVSADPSQVFSICGWEYDKNIDGDYGYPCYQPTNSTDNSKAIRGIFVMAVGKIRFKFNGSNNFVCSATSGLDATIKDCNGTAKATCDKMTVFNGNKNSLGEVNNLSEEISFSMDDNYSSMKIYAGGGFPFGMTFIDTISWENDKTVKDAAALKQTIMNTYFVGGRGYLNEIKSKLQNGFNSMKQGDELKLSDADVGSWSCSNEGNYINKIVTKCTYRVNTAYLYYVNSGKISYTQSENSINGGNKFYVALSYELEQYRWQMKTGNLSILKIRTSKDSYVPNVTFNFKIDTPDIRSVLPDSNGNGKACYINVYQDFYHTGDGDGDGTDDGDTLINTNEVKFSYRTVNISYPFPNNVKADNWSDYCDNHNCSAVFKESYNDGNLEYKTKPLTGSVLTSINRLDNTLYGYKGFNSIDIYGSNSFISDRYFETRNGRHCYIGKLVDWTGKKGCAE